MIFGIIWPFILKECRLIFLTALIGGIYGFIYHQGYKSCENEVSRAEEKAALETQENANKALKAIQDDNAKEKARADKLEGQLNVELKKNQYMDCVITPNGVRLLNQYIQ